MKEQIEKINEVAHKLAQNMYSQAQEPGDTPTDGGDPSADNEGNTERKLFDVVVFFLFVFVLKNFKYFNRCPLVLGGH